MKLQSIRFFSLCFILPLLFFACGSAEKKPSFTLDEKPAVLDVGHMFTYQHSGPLPWGGGEPDVSGNASVTVVGREEQKGGPLWVLEEEYENAIGIQTAFVDDQYRLRRQLIHLDDGDIVVEYSPPMPQRYLDLKEGDSKRYSTRQKLINRTTGIELGIAEITIATLRNADVRIVAPAGAFMCRHFFSKILIDAQTADFETIQFSATEEAFWCDRIAWYVQRNYIFDPLMQDGQIARPGFKTETVLIDTNAPYR